MSGQPVENVEVSDLCEQIEDARCALSEAEARLAACGEELERSTSADRYDADVAKAALTAKRIAAEEVDLLAERVVALERRRIDVQEALSRRRSAEGAERLQGQARERRDVITSEGDALIAALRVAATAARSIDEARRELADLRPRLQAASDAAGLGLDVRTLTTAGLDFDRDHVRFGEAALGIIAAALERQPITRGRWQDYEGLRGRSG